MRTVSILVLQFDDCKITIVMRKITLAWRFVIPEFFEREYPKFMVNLYGFLLSRA